MFLKALTGIETASFCTLLDEGFFPAVQEFKGKTRILNMIEFAFLLSVGTICDSS